MTLTAPVFSHSVLGKAKAALAINQGLQKGVKRIKEQITNAEVRMAALSCPGAMQRWYACQARDFTHYSSKREYRVHEHTHTHNKHVYTHDVCICYNVKDLASAALQKHVFVCLCFIESYLHFVVHHFLA